MIETKAVPIESLNIPSQIADAPKGFGCRNCKSERLGKSWCFYICMKCGWVSAPEELIQLSLA